MRYGIVKIDKENHLRNPFQWQLVAIFLHVSLMLVDQSIILILTNEVYIYELMVMRAKTRLD